MFWYVLVKGDSFQNLNIANLEISFVPNAKNRGCFGTQRNFTINWWSTPLTDSAHAYVPSANIVPVFYKILILKTGWTLQDSNLRPSGYEPPALPTELKVQNVSPQTSNQTNYDVLIQSHICNYAFGN